MCGAREKEEKKNEREREAFSCVLERVGSMKRENVRGSKWKEGFFFFPFLCFMFFFF